MIGLYYIIYYRSSWALREWQNQSGRNVGVTCGAKIINKKQHNGNSCLSPISNMINGMHTQEWNKRYEEFARISKTLWRTSCCIPPRIYEVSGWASSSNGQGKKPSYSHLIKAPYRWHRRWVLFFLGKKTVNIFQHFSFSTSWFLHKSPLSQGCTPVLWAKDAPCPDLVKFLCEHGFQDCF